MGASTNLTVSKKELIRLAIKLREDLIDYEDKLGSSREFAELMNSAINGEDRCKSRLTKAGIKTARATEKAYQRRGASHA